jgi:hypothetical protein
MTATRTLGWLITRSPAFLIMSSLAFIVGACSADVTPNPTPPPATPSPVTSSESSLLVPGTSAARYADPDLGFSFSYASDWTLDDPPGQDGVIVSLTSPDGQVIVDVIRDFPPPTIDIVSYARVMTDILRLSLPSLEVGTEEAVTLPDGTPAYRLQFSVAGDNRLSGDLLVMIRTQGEIDEAFIIQASGPEGPYIARTGPILLLLQTFRLDLEA